jgi:hypothetical protein
MIRTIVHFFPGWLLICISIFFSTALVLSIFAIKRRYFPTHIERGYNDLVNVLARALGMIYALLLGLTIVELEKSYTQIGETLAIEANAYSSALDAAKVLPPATADAISVAINAYVRDLFIDDWQALREDQPSPRDTDQAIHAVFFAIANYEPRTKAEETFYNEALNQFNVGLNQRAMRWSAAQDDTPDIIKMALFINAVLLIFMTCMLTSFHQRAQIWLTVLTNALIITSFVLILLIEYPFVNASSLAPKSFTLVYRGD